MLDQATRLRKMAAVYREQASGTRKRRLKALAVTSGKGGVGKTNISINLAHALVGAGKEVVLLDADLGLANAEILLGAVPPYHLGHLLQGERDITEVIHRAPGNLKLIAGGAGFDSLADVSPGQLRTFLQGLRRLEDEADYLILDTGAGISDSVQEFVLAADMVLVVTTPEPTSLTDAYTTIKVLARRRPGIALHLVINQTERSGDASDAAERIIVTARDFLGVKVEYLGSVPRDPWVREAVRSKVPFVLSHPGAPASRAINRMAQRLLNCERGNPVSPWRHRFFDRLSGLFRRRNSRAL